jgi:ATP-dependent DNA helicase RecG
VPITAAAGTLDFAAAFGSPTDCHYLKSGRKVQDELAGALHQLRRGTRLRKPERQALAFKAPSRSPKETFANLTDVAVCFANSAGGVIVLGIADDLAGMEAIVGTDLTASTVRYRPGEALPPTKRH